MARRRAHATHQVAERFVEVGQEAGGEQDVGGRGVLEALDEGQGPVLGSPLRLAGPHERRQVVDHPVEAIDVEVGAEGAVLDADVAARIDHARDLRGQPLEPVEDRVIPQRHLLHELPGDRRDGIVVVARQQAGPHVGHRLVERGKGPAKPVAMGLERAQAAYDHHGRALQMVAHAGSGSGIGRLILPPT